MKHIRKEEEPKQLTEWKKKRLESCAPLNYKVLGKKASSVKRKVYDSLLSEQGNLCCYCERELEGEDYHLEHLKPQSKFPDFQLAYDNFLCSCQRHLEKGEPAHCGNYKDNWFDENVLISPLDSDCEERFKYTFDGDVYPKNEADTAAKVTIEKLNLSIDKLNNLRKEVLAPFLDEELSEEEVRKFAEGYLKDKSENEGKFNPFYTTIKYLFKE